MAIYALAGNKGGSGKTTVCINLAAALARQRPTLVLDTDPQRSSLQWRDIAAADHPLGVIDAVDDVGEAVDRYRHDYADLVIDCPPSVRSPQTRRALTVADLVLIPVLPSPLDLWAGVHIESEVAQAREVNPALQARLLINQLEPRTRLSNLMREALAELAMPVAQTALRRRMPYRSAMLEGRTVLDMGARGTAAAAEILQLIGELGTFK